MVSTMCRFLAVFSLTVAYLSCAEADFNKHVSLISDVHNAYGTSGIFFVFPRKKFSMDEYTTAYSLTRTYSRQGVSTLMTNYEDLTVHLSNYWKRTARPLVVVLVESMDGINEFKKKNDNRMASFLIWLVIFQGQSIDPVCKYCRRPEGNRLNLRFNTLMRVVCCNEEELQEWWSVRKNHTEIGYIGTWSADKRLKLVATDKIKSRRRDLRGAEIRVTAMPINSSAAAPSFGRLWDSQFKIMERDLHCKLIFPNTTMGDSYHSWKSIQEGSADVAALVALASKLTRFKYVLDHSKHLLPVNLYITVPDTMSVHLAHFKVFESKIWLVIIALVVTTPVLLTIMKLQQGAKSSGSLYSENCLCVWGIFCQQGIPKFSVPTSMRIAYVSIFISGVIVYIAYSASLISILSNISFTLPFSNLSRYIEDGSYRMIVLRENFTSIFIQVTAKSIRDSKFGKIAELLNSTEDLPETMTDAWRRVCSERVALAAYQPLRKIRWNNCRLIEINVTPRTYFVMPLAPNGQYTDALIYHNKLLRRMNQYDTISKYHTIKSHVPETIDNVPDNEFVPGSGILFILVGGMILSLIILFCETIYYRWNNRQRELSLQAKPRNIKMRNFFHNRRRHHLRKKNRRLPLSSSVGKLKASVVRY